MIAAHIQHPMPERPLMGPQAQYHLAGHNIGMGDGPPCIHFKEDEGGYRAGLEYVLFHLERFDEPSRYMILAGTALHFGMPFETVMEGML